MKITSKTSALTFIFVLVSYCISNAQPAKNAILFHSIDDWVEVFVNGELVFKQASDRGQLKQDINFDLNPFINNLVDPIVEIKLVNAMCSTCDTSNGWTIEFEVFQDGESVDYIIEEGDSMGGDVVWSITYEWGYI
ncbi:MAG: hypothetical protein R8N23_11125 [Reichenbachiella sp.]|uniref:hypothetical protein n=1 Tax=Reichenbachiella sp. TaxID=2184521 RepID=UPI00296663D6|nr:hypothetical protein [Reichenbachiella sp.]MDW3210413.1 hypothetical protein [Reichenbachiella sp.]